MNIKLTLVSEPSFTAITGGGCAETDCYINIDKNQDEHTQVGTTIHEVLCAALWIFPHDKIEQLTDDIMEALDQLYENKNKPD